MLSQAQETRNAMLNRLITLSEQGKYPILMDTSPCQSLLIENKAKISGLALFEPVGFIETHLVNRV